MFSQEQNSCGYYNIVYRTSSGAETLLTSFTYDEAADPDVSADGSKIVFDDTLYTYNENGQAIGGGQGIWVMSSDGSGLTQLTFPDVSAPDTDPSQFTDHTPRWPQDGNRIWTWFDDQGSMTLGYLTTSDSWASATGSTETDVNAVGSEQVGPPRMSGDGNTAYYTIGGGSTVHDEVYMNGSWTQNQVAIGESDESPTPVKETWPNASTKTIVALGDSVAAGEGINYGYSWDNPDQEWTSNGSSGNQWWDTSAAMGANYQNCSPAALKADVKALSNDSVRAEPALHPLQRRFVPLSRHLGQLIQLLRPVHQVGVTPQ